jgi:hypothetical protein
LEVEEHLTGVEHPKDEGKVLGSIAWEETQICWNQGIAWKDGLNATTVPLEVAFQQRKWAARRGAGWKIDDLIALEARVLGGGARKRGECSSRCGSTGKINFLPREEETLSATEHGGEEASGGATRSQVRRWAEPGATSTGTEEVQGVDRIASNRFASDVIRSRKRTPGHEFMNVG